MDEFSDLVDDIYKTFFGKFWGKTQFKELKNNPRSVRQNVDVYDLLTDHGYKYDLLHRTYTDPVGNPVLNPEYVYLNLKNRNQVPWKNSNEK